MYVLWNENDTQQNNGTSGSRNLSSETEEPKRDGQSALLENQSDDSIKGMVLKMKWIKSLSAVLCVCLLVFLIGCSDSDDSPDAPPNSPLVSESAQIDQPLVSAQQPQFKDYSLFINANLPTAVMAMGTEYTTENGVGICSIQYPLADGNIKFLADILGDYTTVDPSTAVETSIYCITLQCSDKVKITDSNLFTGMSVEEVSAWCDANGFEHELNEYTDPGDNSTLQTMLIYCGGINISYNWTNDSFSYADIWQKWNRDNETEAGIGTGTPDSYDPYGGMSEFEYKQMIYSDDTPKNSDILRDIYSYTGRPVVVSGQVKYVSSLVDDDMSLLVSVNDFVEPYIVTCTSTSHIPVIEGDHIIIWGEITGLAPYYTTNAYGTESTNDSYSVAVRYYEVNQYTQEIAQFTPEEKELYFNHTYEITGTGPFNDPLSEYELEHDIFTPTTIELTDSTINGYPYTILEGSIERDLEYGRIKLKIVYPAPRYEDDEFQRSIYLYPDGRLMFCPGSKPGEYDSEHLPNSRSGSVDETYAHAVPYEFMYVHYKKIS